MLFMGCGNGVGSDASSDEFLFLFRFSKPSIVLVSMIDTYIIRLLRPSLRRREHGEEVRKQDSYASRRKSQTSCSVRSEHGSNLIAVCAIYHTSFQQLQDHNSSNKQKAPTKSPVLTQYGCTARCSPCSHHRSRCVLGSSATSQTDWGYLGVTGLLIAHGLKQAGISFSIFESEPSVSHYRPREWSMGIHWALPQLEALLPPHLKARLKETQNDPFLDSPDEDEFRMYNGLDGTILRSLPLPKTIRVSRRKLRALASEGIDVQACEQIVS